MYTTTQKGIIVTNAYNYIESNFSKVVKTTHQALGVLFDKMDKQNKDINSELLVNEMVDQIANNLRLG